MFTSTLPLDFTDGDTLKRFTVTDPAISPTTPPPQLTVRRTTIADVDDPGWIYTANIVGVSSGSFEVLVAAYAGDASAAPGEYPNEVVNLVYTVQ